TRDLIDEMKAGVATRTFVGYERRQRGQSPAGLLGCDHAILVQAAEHVGEPLLRAARVPVGTEIIRTLGQTRKQRAFPERELLHRLTEIATRGELDAPGAAAEIDGIEIELENLRLAERGCTIHQDWLSGLLYLDHRGGASIH